MKTILITGANRGIGYEVCRQLSSYEYNIILCSRDIKKGIAAASSLPGNVCAFRLDVTDEKSIKDLYYFVHTKYGVLDVLINNAGIGSDHSKTGLQKINQVLRIKPEIKNKIKSVLGKMKIEVKSISAADVSVEEIKLYTETNLYGPWRMIKSFIPLLEQSNDPRIINVSSGMGQFENLSGDYPAYRISKASLNALTVMFANELTDKKIKVNAVCPGWVKTDMGGPNAPRSVEKGAETIVWTAINDKTENGKFYKDKQVINW